MRGPGVFMYYVYILARKRNGALYVGVTNDLVRRIYEHKTTTCNSFALRYHIHTLVYYAGIDDLFSAMECEKLIKKWKRIWKLALLEKINPTWEDLYEDIV